jgi:FMN phosphatase YigB (HAD superfamily)
MKKSKYKAVIFDFYGTLVPIYTVNPYHELLSAMADEIGIPTDFFIDRWLSTFRERVMGKLPNVHSNIRKICDEFGVSPTKEQCDLYGKKQNLPPILMRPCSHAWKARRSRIRQFTEKPVLY